MYDAWIEESGEISAQNYEKLRTGKYKVYFRLWPFVYYVAMEKKRKRLILVRKIWDGGQWGHYRWEEI